ncbi:MAG: hypothetical protein JWQ97_2092, partial [Phenylobacterium sp.]|nr:hypothetical protein [Phenylobacterium sp.]
MSSIPRLLFSAVAVLLLQGPA